MLSATPVELKRTACGAVPLAESSLSHAGSVAVLTLKNGCASVAGILEVRLTSTKPATPDPLT